MFNSKNYLIQKFVILFCSQVALYQLSQVYLEQNETTSALTSIRSAKSQCKSPNSNSPIVKSSSEKYRPCLWGGRCIRRDEICTGILIQEADILREMGYFKLAARVCSNFFYKCRTWTAKVIQIYANSSIFQSLYCISSYS